MRKILTLLLLNGLFNTVLSRNVGIGTTSPQARLHIQIDNSYTQPALIVEEDGVPSPYLIVSPDGKVGIGVSAPPEALDVSGNIRLSGALHARWKRRDYWAGSNLSGSRFPPLYGLIHNP